MDRSTVPPPYLRNVNPRSGHSRSDPAHCGYIPTVRCCFLFLWSSQYITAAPANESRLSAQKNTIPSTAFRSLVSFTRCLIEGSDNTSLWVDKVLAIGPE